MKNLIKSIASFIGAIICNDGYASADCERCSSLRSRSSK